MVLNSEEDERAELKTTPLLNLDILLPFFKKSSNKIFFLDYDGTLTPIRKTPSAAVPSESMLTALKKLTSASNTYVYVISGRDQGALDEWLGHIKPLGMSAEHGCFMKYPNSEKWINLIQEMDFSWMNEVYPIFDKFTNETPGSFIETKKSSLTWHYRLADEEKGSQKANECHEYLETTILPKFPIEILSGKKNLEIRPKAINKGEIVKKLIGLTKDVDFIFCAGDDQTDEDMFKVLKNLGLPKNNVHTVTIGGSDKDTQAYYHVPSTEEFIEILQKLSENI